MMRKALADHMKKHAKRPLPEWQKGPFFDSIVAAQQVFRVIP